MPTTDNTGAMPASAAAMDELNLDDLFLGGGDGGGDDLFGELDDMDLAGFDEMSPAAGGGSGQKRKASPSGGAGFEYPSASIDRALSPSPIPGQKDSPKGKKSPRKKRKTKKAMGDSDVDSDEGSFLHGVPSPSTPGKGKAKGRGKKESKTSRSKKRPAKVENDSVSPPPPPPRPGSGGINIAALPKHLQGSAIFASSINLAEEKSGKKSKSSRKKQKSKDTVKTPDDFFDEQSFCGLPPGLLFYPFMPIPGEVAMKKLQKLVPCFDKIYHNLLDLSGGSSAGMSNGLLNGSGAGISNPHALFHLFVDHLGETDHKKKGDDQVLVAGSGNSKIQKAIDESRKVVSKFGAEKLVKDVRETLRLVKRQSRFTAQNLENMEAWCKINMSAEEYAAGFLDEPEGEKKSVLPPVTSMAPVYVKVTLNFIGAKAAKGPLLAQLPIPPEIIRAAAISSPTKRRSRTSTGTPAESQTADATPASVPYENLSMAERRRFVTSAIATQAYEFDKNWKKSLKKQQAVRLETEFQIHDIITNDPVEVCHTSTLWTIMKRSRYIAEICDEDIREGLAESWQPEMAERDMQWGEIPPIRIRTKKTQTENGENDKANDAVQSSKLFDRLQSLLVDLSEDENTPGEKVHPRSLLRNGIQSDHSAAEVYASNPNSKAPLRSLKLGGRPLLDLSKLSIDQRTYVQLRALGLADAPFLPSVLPVVEEEGPDNSRATEGAIAETGAVLDDDIDRVIRRMQVDLSGIHRVNNTRAALLQSSAWDRVGAQKQAKRRDEDSASLIAKHSQLLKKHKDAQSKKAKALAKTSADDPYALPW